MSSIPNTKMKHAHVHHDAPPEHDTKATPPAAPKTDARLDDAATSASPPETMTTRGHTLTDDAVAAVKGHPKTVATIGAAVLAGAAALFGGPAIAKAIKGEPKPAPKKAPAKKPAARKPAAKKPKA